MSNNSEKPQETQAELASPKNNPRNWRGTLSFLGTCPVCKTQLKMHSSYKTMVKIGRADWNFRRRRGDSNQPPLARAILNLLGSSESIRQTGLTNRQLARNLKVSLPTVCAALTRLRKKDLVTKHIRDHHWRIKANQVEQKQENFREKNSDQGVEE